MTEMHKKGERKNTFALYNYNFQIIEGGKERQRKKERERETGRRKKKQLKGRKRRNEPIVKKNKNSFALFVWQEKAQPVQNIFTYTWPYNGRFLVL